MFANSNNLKTEDIESKIRDINNSIKTNVSEPITTAEEVITKQETVKEQIEDWEVTTLSSAFGEEPSNTVIEEEVYKEDDVDVAPNKRIVLSLKTVHQFEHINQENIKEMLEKLSGFETSVLFNQKDSILQEEFTNPGHLIFVVKTPTPTQHNTTVGFDTKMTVHTPPTTHPQKLFRHF